jgi:hypothetical protein
MPTRYAPDKSFDPAIADAMGEAFHLAWQSVAGSPYVLGAKEEWTREILALRIIDTAQAGEHDVTRLRDDALAHLANAKLKKA